MHLILFAILIWPFAFTFTVAHLNVRGLLPGTRTYQQRQSIEAARSAAIVARYRANEDVHLNQRMLEAGK